MKKVVSKKDIEKEIKDNETLLINEGFWEDFKYYTAKVTGRYKANGKFFGKSKVDAEAKAKIDAILNKAGNDVIKRLDDFIKQTNPEFPNNRKGDDFLATVLHIANIYDSLENATKLQPNEKGFLPIDAANSIIVDLREYVKKFLDTDLRAVYTGLDEDEENIELGNENQLLNELDADETRANLKSRRSGGDDFGSTRMDTLKSNRLPIALSAIGGLVAAAGWIGQTDWFLDWLKGLKEFDFRYATDVIEKNIKMNPNGFSYTLQDNLPTDKALNLNFNQSVENLKEALKFYGNGSVENGIKVTSEFIDPSQRAASIENLMSQLSDPSNKTIGDVFNVGEGTYGRAGTLFSQFGGAKGVIAKYVVKRLVGILVKQSAGVALGSALASVAPVLLPLGISMIAAGALVKLFRMKGQKQSRAATLNDLYQMLREIQPTKNNDTVIGLLPPAKTEPDTQKQIGGGSQKRIGQGEPEMTISGGKTKERGKPDFSKLDAQDTEFEPIDEPEGQKQIGSGAKRLGQGGTSDSENEIKDNLIKFFKDIIRIKPKPRQRKNVVKEDLQNNQKINDFKQTNQDFKKLIEDFQINAQILSELAKSINKFLENKSSNKNLITLAEKIKSNPIHSIIVDVESLIENNINDKKLIIEFIKQYISILKKTNFGLAKINLLKEEESNVKYKVKNYKVIENMKLNFPYYLKDLLSLIKLFDKQNKNTVNKTDSKINKTGNFDPTASKNLKEDKKKNKYSKKASEFIGKEISHLKKDKGYTQDRAVAAAINVAKDKGMKVGKKANLKEKSLKKIATGLALGAGLMGSPETKGQDYVNPNYSSTSKVTNAVNSEEIKTLKKLNYVLSQIYDVEGHDDYKKPIESSLEGIQKGIKEHLGINVIIRPEVYEKFIQEIKNNESNYIIVKYKGMDIIKWK
jgi:hypothetical protein